MDGVRNGGCDVGPPREPKEIFGSRVAQYGDPDGLAISVGEERHSD